MYGVNLKNMDSLARCPGAKESSPRVRLTGAIPTFADEETARLETSVTRVIDGGASQMVPSAGSTSAHDPVLSTIFHLRTGKTNE